MVQRSPTPRYAWVVMGLQWALDILFNYVGFSLGVMLPVMGEDLGLSPIRAGLLGASFFFAFVIAGLPSAVWLSRFSPYRVTLLLGLGSGLLLLLQGWSPAYWVFLGGRLAFAVLSVARLQAEVMLIRQWFSHRTYAMVNGITFGVIAVAQALGAGATPAFMEVVGGWRNAHYVVGVLTVLVSLAWLRLGNQRPPARRGDASPVAPVKPAETPLGVVARHPALWLVASAQVGAAVAFASYLTFWPTFALQERGMSLAGAGALLTLFSVGGVVGSFAAGPLSEFLGRRKPLVWSAGLALPVLYLLLLLVQRPEVIPFLFLGAGYFAWVVAPPLFTIPYDMGLRPREVAVVAGLIRTVTSTGATLGPLLVGIVQQVSGSLFMAMAVVVPLPLAMTIIGLMLPETGRGRGAPGSPQDPEAA